MSDNHLSMDLDDNSWIYNISKNLNEYIDRPTKQSDMLIIYIKYRNLMMH